VADHGLRICGIRQNGGAKTKDVHATFALVLQSHDEAKPRVGVLLKFPHVGSNRPGIEVLCVVVHAHEATAFGSIDASKFLNRELPI
jgi:hypothetical protein